jgi:hypothetical protein
VGITVAGGPLIAGVPSGLPAFGRFPLARLIAGLLAFLAGLSLLRWILAAARLSSFFISPRLPRLVGLPLLARLPQLSVLALLLLALFGQLC